MTAQNDTVIDNAPEANPPLPDLWFVEQVQDGEYTGPGDNPPGYIGDYEDCATVLDLYGDFVCDCADVETAQRIAREHNAYAELLAACESAHNWIASFCEHAPIVFGSEDALGEELAAVIAKAKGETE